MRLWDSLSLPASAKGTEIHGWDMEPAMAPTKDNLSAGPSNAHCQAASSPFTWSVLKTCQLASVIAVVGFTQHWTWMPTQTRPSCSCQCAPKLSDSTGPQARLPMARNTHIMAHRECGPQLSDYGGPKCASKHNDMARASFRPPSSNGDGQLNRGNLPARSNQHAHCKAASSVH